MSVVMISQVRVTEPDMFQAYMAKTQQVATPYGAELLFRGQKSGTLNGEPTDHQLLVIVRFPDRAVLEEWHSSPEYQELIPLREAGSDQIMTFYQEIN